MGNLFVYFEYNDALSVGYGLPKSDHKINNYQDLSVIY